MDPIYLMFEAIEQKTILLMQAQEEQTGVIRAMTENQAKALMVPVRTFLAKTTPEMKEQHEELLQRMQDLLQWACTGQVDYLFKYHWQPRPYTEEELGSYLVLKNEEGKPWMLLQVPKDTSLDKASRLATRLLRAITGDCEPCEKHKLYGRWYGAVATALDAPVAAPQTWYAWHNLTCSWFRVFLSPKNWVGQALSDIFYKLELDWGQLVETDHRIGDRLEVLKELERKGYRPLPNVALVG